ncbi:UNVERIFIED_CONTAM: hypothetical protein GTU68_037484 [Idotea baltica]|nr:hypothetical protein [Idotea baltica]
MKPALIYCSTPTIL